MKKLKFGLIGFGFRGSALLNDVFIPKCETDIEIAAVCDLYEDRCTSTADKVEKEVGYRPFCTTDYREVHAIESIDAVVIMTAWEAHIEIAVAAMKAGKDVAMEVGGAYSIEDCWTLVDTEEQTGKKCMLMENCCYGDKELMALRMERLGVLGTVVHCSGGYMHDLRYEVGNGEEMRHYRLRNYINRNCDNYPTHEIGPIAKLLNINNGNRFVSLTSTASCAKGMHEFIVETKGADHKLAKVDFNQGDVITTVIKCAGGETVTIVLDTTLPRAYSRGFTVRGTKGSYFEDTDMIFLKDEHGKYEWDCKEIWGNREQYYDKYRHPLWQNYDPRGGHGGMDWLVFTAFIECLQKDIKPPIDVYDAALYMSITALSEQSIALGSVPVMFPDFTRGRWYQRKDIVDWEYNLDKINK